MNSQQRRKWNRVNEVSPEPEDENEQIHVWGPKIGTHTARFYEGNWKCNDYDLFDVKGITHFHCFPDPPRRGRR